MKSLRRTLNLFLHEMSQKEIAQKCGISESEISLLLNGKRIPRIETLTKICDGLSISLFQLIEEERAQTGAQNKE